MMEMANNIKTFIGVRDGQVFSDNLQKILSGSSFGCIASFSFSIS